MVEDGFVVIAQQLMSTTENGSQTSREYCTHEFDSEKNETHDFSEPRYAPEDQHSNYFL